MAVENSDFFNHYLKVFAFAQKNTLPKMSFKINGYSSVWKIRLRKQLGQKKFKNIVDLEIVKYDLFLFFERLFEAFFLLFSKTLFCFQI